MFSPKGRCNPSMVSTSYITNAAWVRLTYSHLESVFEFSSIVSLSRREMTASGWKAWGSWNILTYYFHNSLFRGFHMTEKKKKKTETRKCEPTDGLAFLKRKDRNVPSQKDFCASSTRRWTRVYDQMTIPGKGIHLLFPSHIWCARGGLVFWRVRWESDQGVGISRKREYRSWVPCGIS